MAFVHIENYFESMRRMMEFRGILPDDIRFLPGADTPPNPNYDRPTKVMLVLNGYTHTNLEWLAHTKIFELAGKYNIAIFLPSGENSFYLNKDGCNEHMADYVGEELIKYVTKTFGLSEKKEDHYVMGLSMGGFGALHTGFGYADNFSKIAAFSSALIVHEIAGAKPGFVNAGGDYDYYRRTFGDLDQVLTSEKNPEQLILDLQAAGKELPGLYMACGSEDFLIENNREFHTFLEKNNVDHQYHESPGIHDYDFWNQYVEKAILWMLED